MPNPLHSASSQPDDAAAAASSAHYILQRVAGRITTARDVTTQFRRLSILALHRCDNEHEISNTSTAQPNNNGS